MATTLVKVYYHVALKEFAEQHPDIKLSVFIDDFQISMIGDAREVCDKMAEAVIQLDIVVNRDIRAKLVGEKAAVVASSDGCLKKEAEIKLSKKEAEVIVFMYFMRY